MKRLQNRRKTVRKLPWISELFVILFGFLVDIDVVCVAVVKR